MSIDLSNYSAKKYKKIFLVVFAVLFTIVVTIGIASAYYSDFLSDSHATETGSLRISSQQRYYLNGTEKSTIGFLTPGDVVVVELSVENEGNISAWVRESISLADTHSSLLPYIRVLKGAFTQAQVASEDLSAFEMSLVDSVAFSTARVINGSGQDAQVEGGGGFEYLGESFFSTSFTIYLDFSAPNSTQGKALSLAVTVKALQFRNNNSAVPTEQQWATVEPAV